MCKRRMTTGAASSPISAVKITKTAVITGTPPTSRATSIAMGVVMERGARLLTTEACKCMEVANSTEEEMAVTTPAAIPETISAACLRRM
ncbi:hypothetical protein BM613_03475 [Sulfoacidibacillus thermotolerans]|uniref:Uncharacterized protein n=1 Tax=Sulfoacidibacillus thermotolerans TaxID=1765684 RepID=A0A2U3DAI8_SULT2|nr:hypothetical protein BM613_03475 [Sulfoacidibacillus thermotolerans]